jgi:uncharacterized OsmC-like protein
MSRAVIVIGGPGLRQAISVGPHHLLADEPKISGGSDVGPDPYELLLSALGSCTNMTLRMYADRKKWPLKEIRVALTHSKNYANDCVNCEQPAAMLDRIERRITLIGELPPGTTAKTIGDRKPLSGAQVVDFEDRYPD